MSVNYEHLPALLRLTQDLLARKVLIVMAVVMTFALFCWAMIIGTWLHLSIAAAFAVLVLWPLWLRKEPEHE